MAFSGIRVALVGPLPPPAGGMANQTRQLAELLRSEQAQVTVVQTNAPYRPHWVASVPVLRAIFRLLPYLWAVWVATGRSNVMHIMANSGWSWHLFAAPALWLAKLRGVPVVVNYRGGGADQFLARSKGLVGFSMRRAARLIVPSAFLQEVFARYDMPAAIVPNIIDLSRFSPCSVRTSASVHMVVTRNLEPIYDNATALRAFKIVLLQYPHASLTIAGSGPENQRLHQLANELGVDGAVHFVGRLDRDAMANLYRSADIMLNPSVTDNMPNSVLESMASGVPVVSTNVGGIPYMVQSGVTALLVPPKEPTAMASAILELLNNPLFWAQLSQAGLAEVQRYTWKQVAPVLSAVYHSAMCNSQRRPH